MKNAKLLHKTYFISVEGETEQLYLQRVQEIVNSTPNKLCTCKIFSKKTNPSSYKLTYSSQFGHNPFFHMQDIESNSFYHINKFQNLIKEIDSLNSKKYNFYKLIYSNFSFDLWIVLHKRDMNFALTHRYDYLPYINTEYKQSYSDMDHYKQHDNFGKVLSQITLTDIKNAIKRGYAIENTNQRTKKLIFLGKQNYYIDNPSLRIHILIEQILKDCGV